MALPDGAPNKSALVDEWAEYAINHGVPSYEARNATKDELIARFETEDVETVGPTTDPHDLGPAHGVGSYLPPPPEPREVDKVETAEKPEPVKRATKKGRTDG